MSASLDYPFNALVEQVGGAVAGGVDVVQIREPDLDAKELAAFARACKHVAAGTKCRVIVNDRVDVAVAVGTDGVHLRESSISVDAARRLVSEQVIVGRSVHDARTAAIARTADYLIAGSVFATESKPGQPAILGLEGLRQVVLAAGACPVWAIGGVSRMNLAAMKGCGVTGIAGIGAFLPPSGAHEIAREVQKLTEALRFSLDSTVELP